MGLISILESIDDFFWGKVALTLLLSLGGWLSVQMRFLQITEFPKTITLFKKLINQKMAKEEKGVHPLKVFFASVGGMIGIGNIVGIVVAVQVGGPGALFWVWVAALIGSIVKYAEIFLGIRFRKINPEGEYRGGCLYFLQKAFKNRLLPSLVAVLLCIYGVEIYQFRVITESIVCNWNIPSSVVVSLLAGAVLYAGWGGVARVGQICTLLMPFFISLYTIMALWVLAHHIGEIPQTLQMVFKAAFTGHAAIGGFSGSSIMLAAHQGLARAAYSADIGIGYDSILQSESACAQPEEQARLSLLGVFTDNLICTMTLLLTLVSGAWKMIPQLSPALVIQTILADHFPSMQFFMPLFFIVVGYTTIISYLSVGSRCATFLAPNMGKKIYFLYALAAFLFFSFFDQSVALLIMSLSGASLLCCNLLGIFRLRAHLIRDGARQNLTNKSDSPFSPCAAHPK